jgi:hypothetical protein
VRSGEKRLALALAPLVVPVPVLVSPLEKRSKQAC